MLNAYARALAIIAWTKTKLHTDNGQRIFGGGAATNLKPKIFLPINYILNEAARL